MKTKMKTSEKIIRAKELFLIGKVEGICNCFSYFGYKKPFLFNHEIAVLFFGANRFESIHLYKYCFWWKIDNRKIRIKYFDWMIKIYKFFGK